MQGTHFTADLYDCGCPSERLTTVDTLCSATVQACRDHGLSVVGQLFHGFKPLESGQNGVTGAVILAESHLAIHTWPELRSVTLDIYVCNFSSDNRHKAESLLAELLAYFQPAHQVTQEIKRGLSPALTKNTRQASA